MFKPRVSHHRDGWCLSCTYPLMALGESLWWAKEGPLAGFGDHSKCYTHAVDATDEYKEMLERVSRAARSNVFCVFLFVAFSHLSD